LLHTDDEGVHHVAQGLRRLVDLGGAQGLLVPVLAPRDENLSVREERGRLLAARLDQLDDAETALDSAREYLAEAGAALARTDYLDAARRCADFLIRDLRPDGVLLRTWKDGRAKITGFLEDSAFLADSLITLYEACGDGAYVAAARELVDDALRRFEDDGVLYDTASDAEPLLVRPRTIDDNPIPAGQSVLASALLRIAAVSGDSRFRQRAEAIMGPLAVVVARSPLAVSSLACAMDRAQAPSREVAISGLVEDPRTLALIATVHSHWLPNTVVAWGNADVELLSDRPLVDGRPAAYVCENFACQRPVTDPADLTALLAVAGPTPG